MAITINGTGTITGISAGGLPDNCITAADLATTLDLSSNTVTLPSGTGGKILQVVQHTDNTSRSTTNNTYVTAVSGSITPVAADSDILIISNIAVFYSSGDDTFSTVRISGADFNSSTVALNTNNTQTAQSVSYPVNYLHSPTYTLGNSVTYTLEANNGRNDNSSTIYVNNGGTSVMLLLEVAG